MSHTTVTLQIDLGTNPAGDWANRPKTTEVGTRNARDTAAGRTDTGARDELMVRLHVLRGVIDAHKANVYGPTLPSTYSKHAKLGYATPEQYRSMHFVFGEPEDISAY